MTSSRPNTKLLPRMTQRAGGTQLAHESGNFPLQPANYVVMAVDDRKAVVASCREPGRFAVVFEHHHRAIWQYLARTTSSEVADELAGDVFVAAFAQRQRYDPQKGSVRAWLYGIATNLVRTQLRSNARRTRAYARAAAQLSDCCSVLDRADDAIAGSQELRRVSAALPMLSPQHREILVLSVWEQLSYEEIAVALDIALGTVRSRLARARAELRKLAAYEMPEDIKGATGGAERWMS